MTMAQSGIQSGGRSGSQPGGTAAQPSTFDDTGGVSAPLAAALADELVALTVQLSDLAYDLGQYPDTLRRHMTSIQAIDRITQAQLAIADVLRSDETVVDRLAHITLAGLSSSIATRMDPPANRSG
ncbi:hypothetical protein [Sphingomonas sp. Leaf17]|uniref:hypothetical protein n=1 Tax=Sphingomonas sp. Leaf17 TaxID=1735683 RepID=UPI000A6AE427|nr:hypothetical protein [Sphingomonas sp. Leaf17]